MLERLSSEDGLDTAKQQSVPVGGEAIASHSSTAPARRVRRRSSGEDAYAPLSGVIRTHVTTAEAAFHLNMQPQTLRVWACRESGPIRPIRVGARLGWSVEKLRELLGQ